jgi:5-bromo-4-chloroindolyl phosphate hydrolysis protein
MASNTYTVFWTNQAKQSIDKVIKHLREEWTQKEENNFLDEVDRVIGLIEIYPQLFRASKKREGVHMALIDKHTFLVYQIRPSKKQIALLLFWGTHQNPKQLKY